MSSQKKVAVIGSGIGGLAVALRVSLKGYHVDVFEKSTLPGGKISFIREKGFRFDTGPSLFTLPVLIDELTELSKTENKFKYIPLDNICRYFYPDNTKIDAYRDVDKFAFEIESVTNDNHKSILNYLRKSKEIYELTKDIFIFNDLHNYKNFLNYKTLKGIINAWKLEPFKTLHQSNKKTFKDDRVVKLFDRYATYNGSNPYIAPATLKVIPHLEHNIGAFFPTKGMYSIVEHLKAAGEKVGVNFHFSEEVKSVNVLKGEQHKIITAKREQSYDAVISDVDVMTFNKLVNVDLKKAGKKHQLSTSAIIFYWGMKIRSNDLALHNILFSDNYEEEFDYLFTKKQVIDDPTVYIFISSKVVKTDAPEDHENWFVMINAPENNGQNWQQVVKKAREAIIKKIKSRLNIDIEKHLIYEKTGTPETIEANTGSFHGSLYGISSNNMWAAFRRHPNYIKSIKGLYFVGGTVHPGGGIPLCLASAKIVANLFPNLNPANDKRN